MDELSDELREKFISLQDEARALAAEGALVESLSIFYEARKICPTKKVLSRIQRLEEHIKRVTEENEANDEEEENVEELDDEMVNLNKDFKLHRQIYAKLYDYQREGVSWMWTLFKSRKGGILGDDMGLGKTFQVIAFLSGLIDNELIKHVLIVMPVSLIPNWQREFNKWCPGIVVYTFHGSSKKEREQNLNRVQRRQGVLLTSYGMIVTSFDMMSHLDGRQFVWDYVILDEGHKIKNPTKTTKSVHEIPAKQRLVLTGTPVQNNLAELWALYDFAHHGTLLGSRKTFKMQYETPITRSLEKDSSLGERRLGAEMSESLRNLIQPYFLRRTKSEVLDTAKNDNKENITDELSKQMSSLKLTSLPQKNDFILWVYLTGLQYDLYKNFLQSDAVKKILMATKSPLVELNVLKKICDHPRLLSRRACHQLGLNGNIDDEELNKIIDNESTASSSIENVSDSTLIKESGKMGVVIKLLEQLKKDGHRTLVFSLSRKILDMIQRILTNRDWKILRIDGTVLKTQERDRRIQLFQNNASYPLFLLTTQVGGVGITLTAADRVVIYDPSWNPAVDAQAVDRIFRIGQKKDVVVYRLITCGSVEEKIYCRQIFKDSITRQTTGSTNEPHRYFSKQDLRELFSVENIHYSKTQVQLDALHSKERKTNAALNNHIEYLHTLEIFGISDHDLMFTKPIKDATEDDDPNSVSNDYIKKRVEMAQKMVETEASIVAEGLRETGSYVKPFTLNIPVSAKRTIPDYYQQPLFPSDNHSNSMTVPKIGKQFDSFEKSPVIFEEKYGVSSVNVITIDSPKINQFLQDKPIQPLKRELHFSSNTSPIEALNFNSISSPSRESMKPKIEVNSCFKESDSFVVAESKNTQDTVISRNSFSSVQSPFKSPFPVVDKSRVVPLKPNLESFADLDLYDEGTPVRMERRSARKSCVNRRTTILLSDSEEDEEYKSAVQSHNRSGDILASESDGSDNDDTTAGEISNSIAESTDYTNEANSAMCGDARTSDVFRTFVKDTSKTEVQNSNLDDEVNYNSPNASYVVSTPKKSVMSDSLQIPARLMSPKRLTPLKVSKEVLPSSPFRKALEESVELPSLGYVIPIDREQSAHRESASSTPVHKYGRRRRIIEASDSEDSDDDKLAVSVEPVITFDNEFQTSIAHVSKHRYSDIIDDLEHADNMSFMENADESLITAFRKKITRLKAIESDSDEDFGTEENMSDGISNRSIKAHNLSTEDDYFSTMPKDNFLDVEVNENHVPVTTNRHDTTGDGNENNVSTTQNELCVSNDRNEHNTSAECDLFINEKEHNVYVEEDELKFTNERNKQNLSFDRSKPNISVEENELGLSNKIAKHNLSSNRNECNTSVESVEHNVSVNFNRSEHNVSVNSNKSEHNLSVEKKKLNLSNGNSEHNLSSKQNECNASIEFMEHSISTDKSEYSVSAEGNELDVSNKNSECNFNVNTSQVYTPTVENEYDLSMEASKNDLSTKSNEHDRSHSNVNEYSITDDSVASISGSEIYTPDDSVNSDSSFSP